MTEDWREHPELPGYLFSSAGRAARRLKNGSLRILVGCACGRGYRAISAAVGDGQYKRVYIHRGVCHLFHGAPAEGMECRHINGDMHDNRAENLQWGTPAENSADKRRHGTVTKGELNGAAKLTRAQVEEMRNRRKALGIPFKQLAVEYGVSTMTAYRAAVRKSWN